MKSDAVVIGAGVVGLAIARRLAMLGREVVVLERNSRIGMETSSRNSQVVHAGLYYPKGSLKATMCVQGRGMLYRFCEAHGVEHSRIGKLIVATHDNERPRLMKIAAQATANGVHDLQMLHCMGQVHAKQPGISAVGGLWSPSTGIVDSHGLMLALLSDAEQNGAIVALNSTVTDIHVAHDSSGARATNGVGSQCDRRSGSDTPMYITVESEGSQLEMETKLLINAAGLQAPELAQKARTNRAMTHATPTDTRAEASAADVGPTGYYCKGHYYALHGPHPFRHLVYPLPNTAGLGIHATLNLQGQVSFGPGTEWVSGVDYQMSDDAERKSAFVDAIKRYWPDVDAENVSPSYSGIRPKIVGQNEPAADFMIQGPRETGCGMVHLLGIESPGLTSSLAIAEYVVSSLDQPPA